MMTTSLLTLPESRSGVNDEGNDDDDDDDGSCGIPGDNVDVSPIRSNKMNEDFLI